MTDLNTTQRENYQVRGDTECWRNGDGYDRTLVIVAWDESDLRRMARAQIRVDRFRDQSYAHIDVWVPTTGWQYVTSVDPIEWWDRVPSFTRGPTQTAHDRTMDIVDDLVNRLIEIGI
jgi:hypothetical protein